MQKKHQPLFFIHIPKTAGSSFRVAAEEHFGSEKTFYDYGEKYVETHPKIVALEYQQKDRFATGQYITKHGKFLSGHVPYLKYAPFFNAANTISFIRSPEQHIRSHFEHYVRMHGYQDDFKTFILEKRFINLQSRLINTSLGIDTLGFIGLTEEYEVSLSLINQLYHTDLQLLRVNKNQQKKTDNYQLTDEEVALIQEHNQKDWTLYKQACARFKRQKQAIETSQPFLRFGLLPLPAKQAQHKINGWLTCYESTKAQKLTVVINGHEDKVVTANEYRSILNERNMNRNGYIGFTYHYPENISLNDRIDLYSESTNELLHTTRFKGHQ